MEPFAPSFFLALLAAFVIVLTEIVQLGYRKLVGIFTSYEGRWKISSFMQQFLSWLSALGIAYIGTYIGVSIFPVTNFVSVALYAVVLGLIANGVFDIPLVKTFVVWLESKIGIENA